MPAVGEPQPFRFRTEDHELLNRAFAGRKVEFVDGMVVAVNAETTPPTHIKNKLMFRRRPALRAIGSEFDGFAEPALALPPFNVPEPDVLVARDDTDAGQLGIGQVGIVIEVGAPTLRGDLGTKRVKYAGQGVPEYWVGARQVLQFWGPVDGDDARTRVVPLARPLAGATLPGLPIDGAGTL